MKNLLFLVGLLASISVSAQYVSELEYDVPGTDNVGLEFIEVFYPTGTNPNDHVLSGLDGTLGGIVAVGYTIPTNRTCAASVSPAGQICLYTNSSVNSIRDGATDGIVLINATAGTIVQSFAYEGDILVAVGIVVGGATLTVQLPVTSIGTDPGTAAATSFSDNDGDGTFELGAATPGVLPAPLPIELVSFNAAKKGNAVELSFATTTERNNAYFSIERSHDGVRFEAIGKLDGAGASTTKTDYSYTDERPLKGTNFYRFQQMNFDGQSSYGPIASVTFGQIGKVLLSPQPVLDQMQVILEEPTVEAAIWQVYDFAGRLLQSGTVAAESTNFEINTAILAEGNYALRLINGQQILTQPFQKN